MGEVNNARPTQIAKKDIETGTFSLKMHYVRITLALTSRVCSSTFISIPTHSRPLVEYGIAIVK